MPLEVLVYEAARPAQGDGCACREHSVCLAYMDVWHTTDY